MLGKADPVARAQIVPRCSGPTATRTCSVSSRSFAPAGAERAAGRGPTLRRLPCGCSPEQQAAHQATEQVGEAMRALDRSTWGAKFSAARRRGAPRRRAVPARTGDGLRSRSRHDSRRRRSGTGSRARSTPRRSHPGTIFSSAKAATIRIRALDLLLAHEITHTVQQSVGAVTGIQHSSGVQVNEPGDLHEQEAERKAEEAIRRLDAAPAGGKQRAGSKKPAHLSSFCRLNARLRRPPASFSARRRPTPGKG